MPDVMYEPRERPRQLPLRVHLVHVVNRSFEINLCQGEMSQLVLEKENDKQRHSPVKNLANGTVALRHCIGAFI